jgi:hypothetical protein
MAEAIGEDYETVRKWFHRERIPERAWPRLINKSGGSLNADILLKLNKPSKKRTD